MFKAGQLIKVIRKFDSPECIDGDIEYAIVCKPHFETKQGWYYSVIWFPHMDRDMLIQNANAWSVQTATRKEVLKKHKNLDRDILNWCTKYAEFYDSNFGDHSRSYKTENARDKETEIMMDLKRKVAAKSFKIGEVVYYTGKSYKHKTKIIRIEDNGVIVVLDAEGKSLRATKKVSPSHLYKKDKKGKHTPLQLIMVTENFERREQAYGM